MISCIFRTRTSWSTISKNLYRNDGGMGQSVQRFLIATGKE